MQNPSSRKPSLPQAIKDYLDNDRWNWWFVALAIATALAVAISLYTVRPSSLWEGVDTVDRVVGMFTLLAVLLGWYASVRSGIEAQQQIEIVAVHEESEITLPYRPLRSQLSRGEVMGIMSTYYGEERFPPDEIRAVWETPVGQEPALDAVIKGKTSRLIVPIRTRAAFDRIREAAEGKRASRQS